MGVKISLVKYKIIRDSNGVITNKTADYFDLVKCPYGYFNGFMDPHQN
jgi:hypothetical protein